MLDVSGHRQARRDELTALATDTADAGAELGRAGPAGADEPVRAQGRARRDRRDRRRAQRVRGRGAEPPRRRPARASERVTARCLTRGRAVDLDAPSAPARPQRPWRSSATGCRSPSALRGAAAARASSAGCSARARCPGSGRGTCSTAPRSPTCCRRARASSTSVPAPGCPAWRWRSAAPDLRVDLVEPMLRRTDFLPMPSLARARARGRGAGGPRPGRGPGGPAQRSGMPSGSPPGRWRRWTVW